MEPFAIKFMFGPGHRVCQVITRKNDQIIYSFPHYDSLRKKMYTLPDGSFHIWLQEPGCTCDEPDCHVVDPPGVHI